MYFINNGQGGFLLRCTFGSYLSCLVADLVINGREAVLEYISIAPVVDESHGREMFSKVTFKLCVALCRQEVNVKSQLVF